MNAAQLTALAKLDLGPLADDHAFPVRDGFTAEDSAVVDLAHFLVWAGAWARVTGIHPRVVHGLRRRLHARLTTHFSAREIEELTWRFAQCVAFNWHNEFLELEG